MEGKTIHVTPERLRPLIHEKVTYKSSDDCSLVRQDYEKAYQDLGETEYGRSVALETLRKKIKDDKSVKYRTDEIYLLRYLRHTKYDVGKAYKMLQKFYFFREKNPHVFSMCHLKNIMNAHFITYLPYTDEDGCTYFWLNFRNWNIQEWNAFDLISSYHAMADIFTLNPNLQIHGVKELWDLRGFSSSHMAHVMKTILFLINTLQNSYPYRIKKLVIMHANPVLQATYNSIRLFIKKKIRERIVILGSDISELPKHLNTTVLPKEYGGTLEESECYTAEQHVLENLDYLNYERTAFGPIG